MGVKKRKQAKRSLSSYFSSFGFREPLQILSQSILLLLLSSSSSFLSFFSQTPLTSWWFPSFPFKIHVVERFFFFVVSPKVDGNFSHVALQHKLFLKEALPKTLSTPTKEMVTKCVMDELRGLGEDFMGTVLACKNYEHRKCGHTPSRSAAECLTDLVGKSLIHCHSITNHQACVLDLLLLWLLLLQARTTNTRSS